MTTAVFLILFFSFFIAVLNFLPDASSVSSGFSDGISLVISYMKSWDAIFPISELLTLVVIVSVFYSFMFLWKALQWIIHVVRGGTT